MIVYSQTTVRQKAPAPKVETPAPARPVRIPPNPETDAVIREMWLAGVTVSKISEAVGYRSHGSVSLRAKALGLPPRKKRRGK